MGRLFRSLREYEPILNVPQEYLKAAKVAGEHGSITQELKAEYIDIAEGGIPPLRYMAWLVLPPIPDVPMTTVFSSPGVGLSLEEQPPTSVIDMERNNTWTQTKPNGGRFFEQRLTNISRIGLPYRVGLLTKWDAEHPPRTKRDRRLYRTMGKKTCQLHRNFISYMDEWVLMTTTGELGMGDDKHTALLKMLELAPNDFERDSMIHMDGSKRLRYLPAQSLPNSLES